MSRSGRELCMKMMRAMEVVIRDNSYTKEILSKKMTELLRRRERKVKVKTKVPPKLVQLLIENQELRIKQRI
jgi:hypothetical protein